MTLEDKAKILLNDYGSGFAQGKQRLYKVYLDYQNGKITKDQRLKLFKKELGVGGTSYKGTGIMVGLKNGTQFKYDYEEFYFSLPKTIELIFELIQERQYLTKEEMDEVRNNPSKYIIVSNSFDDEEEEIPLAEVSEVLKGEEENKGYIQTSLFDFI